ncbi:hypothetical protein [Aurantimonas coralicida]|uniref:hypothetical protein n=1 Tax=Aurantimonas coralicida TaxID=182270 RepID=UPI0012DCA21B|nr:hypothetical protein [Aurantimonas coralicida]
MPMQCFLLAGASAPLFEAFKKTVSKGQKNIIVIGESVKTSRPYTYTEEVVESLLKTTRKELCNQIEKGLHASLQVLYVPHPRYEILVDEFAVSTLTFSLPKDTNVRSIADSLRNIMSCVRSFQKNIPVMNEIFESKIRKTPWCLPERNYEIDSYVKTLSESTRLAWDQEIPDFLAPTDLPTTAIVNPKTTVYSDKRGILFIPAKRREFHGHEVAHNRAWLRGVFRLGRSLPVGFHYDARPERAPLSRFSFFDCENGSVTPKSEHQYANITPNDRLRLGKKG